MRRMVVLGQGAAVGAPQPHVPRPGLGHRCAAIGLRPKGPEINKGRLVGLR